MTFIVLLKHYSTMEPKTNLPEFKNRVNVDHIVDNGKEAWLTKPEGFTATQNACGADWLDVTEDGKRVIFFKGEEEVDNYRLSNSLAGSTPEELIAKKHCLLFFETWYPAESRWVKQVAVGKPKKKSAKAIRI